MIERLMCALFGHKYITQLTFSPTSRKVGCTRCEREWAMNDSVRAFVDWSGEFEELYKFNGQWPQPEHPDAQGSPCPEFWNWLPKAYGQTESFSKYNMEVAYLAGKKAQPEQAECDGGQCGIGGYCKQCPKTQPKPEPVAYLCENAVGHKYFRWKKPQSVFKPIALYTAPPQREWVGLTGEELQEIYQGAGTVHFKFAMVEAKLKEKNNG